MKSAHHARALVALGAALVALVMAGTAGATTSAEALAILNAERVANGLPTLVEEPSWSHGCALHNAYLATNGNYGTASHSEVPGAPGYTAEGAWAASRSVLAITRADWGGNPWLTGGYHLAAVLSPNLVRTGVSASSGYSCMVVSSEGKDVFRETANRLYSFPGDGRTEVPFRETTNEVGAVPGDQVGLPKGATTGPLIFLFASGPWSRGAPWPADWEHNAMTIDAGSLVGPAGPVELRFVNGAAGATTIAIPVSPLAPLTRYSAQVTVRNENGVSMTRSWSFTTSPRDNDLSAGATSQAGRVRVEVPHTDAPNPRAWISGGGWTVAVPLQPVGGSATAFESPYVDVPGPGVYLGCAESGGPPTDARQRSSCGEVTVAAATPRRVGLSARARLVSVRGRSLIRVTGRTAASERGRIVRIERRSGRRYVALCRARVRVGGGIAASCDVSRLRRARPVVVRLRARLSAKPGEVEAVASFRIRLRPLRPTR
ncbi:MAG: CAP domain-containing protein [Dehalococcoidia bacterium]